MKTKQLILGVGLSLLGFMAHGQGLEKLIVEKYYVTDAADAAQADADIDAYNDENGTTLPHGALPVGSVTYRFYVDLLPGYTLLTVYGDAGRNQLLQIKTTTHFYNHPLGTVSPVPGTTKAAIKNNILALDSYVTVGGVATNQGGILKADDNTTGNNITAGAPVLQNNVAPMDPPALFTKDGMITQNGVAGPGYAAFSTANNEALNDGTVLSGDFTVPAGGYFSTNGAVGPDATTNRILIAQITTDGVLSYKFNLFLKAPDGTSRNYVYGNAGPGDIVDPTLQSGVDNLAPVVNITSPANGASFTSGANVAIAATATDDGTVASVEFKVDGVSVGVDNTAPFEAAYIAGAVGAHTIIATATDNLGLTGSDTVAINVVNKVAPTVAITSPADGSNFQTGAAVAIAATAADADGTVASVEFLVDGVSVGTDNSAPYEATYTAVAGAHTIIAKATDNDGLTGSDTVSINVAQKVAPNVTITSPANGTNFQTGAAVAIAATAADADGTVASVEFLVDGVSVGTDNSAPYEATYTALVGNHTIIAKATDNDGLTDADTVSIHVADKVAPNVTITSPANGTSFSTGANVAIAATATDADGTVASVEFLVDGVSVGTDNSAPYQASYAAVAGAHTIIAKATDNDGLTDADTVAINVVNKVAPTVTITSPANGTGFQTGANVAIAANAADTDGTVASVQFFVDGVSVGTDNAAPYQASYVAATGVHQIVAKATDNDGLTDADTVSISVTNPNGGAYTIGTITGFCSDPSFCLPVVAVDSVKNVIGYDLVLNYNPAKVHATGNVTLNSALINPSFASYVVNNNAVTGQINISVYLNNTAPANAGFNGVGELLCVEFTKDAALLATDTVSFNVPFLQESYVIGVSEKPADAGNFINKKNTIYKGALKFWTDNSPIKYNAANPAQYLITNIYGTDASCGNKSATAVQPDTLGVFSYNILNGSNVQIERDINNATDVQTVINGFDAGLGNKVLVNDLSFIPNIYQVIALDVNADGVISAGDVSQINQRSVSTLHEFKQKWNASNGQPSKDWLFLDTALLNSPAYHISATYPSYDGKGFNKAHVPVVPFCLKVPVSNSVSCPVLAQSDYKGVLIGDVNGNYDAIPADGQLKREAAINANGVVYINLDQAKIGSGYVDVPVSIVSSDKVVSLDFATKFNENVLSFDKVISYASYLTDALANYDKADKTLRFTSNSFQQYENDKTIATLRFNTLNGVVNNSDLTTVRGLLNGNAVKIEVKGNITTGIFSTDKNISVLAYPNPANGIINVVSPERAIVELTDLQGRQVVLSTMVNANEKQEISTENIAAGMYLLKVYNENFISTQRIVVDNIK